MSRVLVTGATGFVGRAALAALVRDGHEVAAVASARGPEDPGGGRGGPRGPDDQAGVDWHRADLLADPTSAARMLAATRPEILVHLAWYAEHGSFWAAPENLDWVAASLHLLREFAKATPGGRVVIAGTCAEYEWARSVYAEDAPCAPRTVYGAAKHGLRVVAEAFAREHGLSFAWGRLFFLYGPGEAPRRFVPSLARALLAGDAAPMTDGTQIRDFLHVADAGAAFAALAAATVEGPVNIASGIGISLRDLAAMIADNVGGRGRLELGAIPTRPDDPPSLVADVARLRDAVGWRPRITLGDGLAQTVDAWRAAAG